MAVDNRNIMYIHMINNILAPSLEVGNTILNIKDTSKLQKFYQSGVGLELLSKEKNEVVLGQDQKKIITLSGAPDLPYALKTSAGLYHNAIVFKSRGKLANTLKRLFKDYPNSFIGSADHFVSEAFYFVDPEGNELELYFDRDRSQWEWENGYVKMGVEYIDPISYIHTYSAQDDSEEKRMGHVHLKVGDVQIARKFYVNTVGFNVTAEMPQALFVSVGEYHHHIGMNSWQSFEAQPRNNSLGLQSIELILPTKQDVDTLASRLEKNNIPLLQKKETLIFQDPWNNVINIKSQ